MKKINPSKIIIDCFLGKLIKCNDFQSFSEGIVEDCHIWNEQIGFKINDFWKYYDLDTDIEVYEEKSVSFL